MKELDYGNCEVVTLRGKEAYVNDMGLLRIGTGYKAAVAGKLARHSESRSVSDGMTTRAQPTVQLRR